MNTKDTTQVSIDPRKIILRCEQMEPVVLPRSAVRTKLRLLDCVYRLAGWPGMKLPCLQEFIRRVYQLHGWELPRIEAVVALETEPSPEHKRETMNRGRSFQTSDSSEDCALLQLAA